MDHMFYDADAFNGEIGDWNVSSVTNMSYMFYNTAAFNKYLNDWDVSNVVSMYGMFAWARAFNKDVSSWKLSSISDMPYMFYKAKAFNQNLCAWGDEIDNDAIVTAMFFHSKYPERGCPDLRKSSPGPFCMNCNLDLSQ